MDKNSYEYFMTKMTQEEFEYKMKGHKKVDHEFNHIQPERSKREDSFYIIGQRYEPKRKTGYDMPPIFPGHCEWGGWIRGRLVRISR